MGHDVAGNYAVALLYLFSGLFPAGFKFCGGVFVR